MENSKTDKNELFPKQEVNAFDASAEMEWFNSFQNTSGIFDNYTSNDLKDLQTRMLIDLKNKINKFD